MIRSDITDGVFNRSGLFGFGGYSVDLAVRALFSKAGSDLMSAPKITVLSGKRATITVAQEFRYPESYGDIESNRVMVVQFLSLQAPRRILLPVM
jgi:type II secretory pathway component GspD/PulD (secretin)